MILNDEQLKYKSRRFKNIESIRKMVESKKYILAIKDIIKFNEEFGYDCQVIYYYGKSLRKTGRVKEAIEVLSNLLEYQDEYNLKQYYFSTKMELFKVYFINNYYKEAYILFNDLRGSFQESSNFKEYYIERLLKIRLGEYEEDINGEPVSIDRVLHYDEKQALEHIQKHLPDYNDCGCSEFNDINIVDLLERVKNALPLAKKLQRFSLNDVYLFRFSRIGADNSNLLLVVTNKGTYEVVSMYPTTTEYVGVINHNLYNEYLEEKGSNENKMSQIDKFNKRYFKKMN